MTIRSTYALDVETVRNLERLAKEWGVSKSEALRRSIQSAAASTGTALTDKLQGLEALQHSLDLSERAIHKWQSESRAMRRASSASRTVRRK